MPLQSFSARLQKLDRELFTFTLLGNTFMPYEALADLAVILHLGFVLFVLLGGLVILKWRRAIWLHLPAVAWGAVVEFTGWTCPLTPLENWLRAQGGGAGSEGDFVLRYLQPLLYPGTLTREIQISLGALLVAVNVAIYGWICRTRGKS